MCAICLMPQIPGQTKLIELLTLDKDVKSNFLTSEEEGGTICVGAKLGRDAVYTIDTIIRGGKL